jgi:hypothetical protein
MMTDGGTAGLVRSAHSDGDGTVRVTIVNKDELFAGTISLPVPGKGTGTVLQLLAPAYASTSGVTYGGQTFDGCVDGAIVDVPSSRTVNPVNQVYSISLKQASAVLPTFP